MGRTLPIFIAITLAGYVGVYLIDPAIVAMGIAISLPVHAAVAYFLHSIDTVPLSAHPC